MVSVCGGAGKKFHTKNDHHEEKQNTQTDKKRCPAFNCDQRIAHERYALDSLTR